MFHFFLPFVFICLAQKLQSSVATKGILYQSTLLETFTPFKNESLQVKCVALLKKSLFFIFFVNAAWIKGKKQYCCLIIVKFIILLHKTMKHYG